MTKYLSPIGLLAAVMVLLSTSFAMAQKKAPTADGRVSIEQTQFAIILGGSTGGGRLSFKDRIYNFRVGGLTVGANVGLTQISATGEVFGLKDVSKFPGTYTVLDASATLGGGAGGLRMRNQNGVVLTLTSRNQGVQLNIGSVSGVTITME